MKNKTLNWGILGVSSIARDKIIPAIIASKNGRLAALGTRNVDKGRQVTTASGIDALSLSYQEVIESPDIDAVYISLPNTMHFEWAMQALDNGKHILVDKPLAISSRECVLIAQRAADKNLQVMEGLMYRHHPQNKYVMDVIRSGEIGEVREAHIYNAFRLMDSITADNIRVWDGSGAGAIMDMGCYVMSAARMIMEDEPLVASGWIDEDEELAIDVGGAAMLSFDCGRFASLNWSFRTGFGAGYRVIGSKQMLEVPIAFIPGQAGQRSDTFVYHIDPSGHRRKQTFAPTDSFRLQFEEFGDALSQRRDPNWGADDAIANAKGLELLKALPTHPSSL